MRAIFVGGPDSKKFLNNYFSNLSGKGIEVTRHWMFARRKSFIPGDVDFVIVNQDAVSTPDKDHIRDVCDRSGVPLVIGNNSASETYERIISQGLVSKAQVEVAAAAAAYAPESVSVDANGCVHIPGDGLVFTDGLVLSPEYVAGMRFATAADVSRLSPGTSISYDVVSVDVVVVDISNNNNNNNNDNSEEEKTMINRIEEPTKMNIDVNGSVRLVTTTLANNNKESISSTRPVVWGDELFVSKTGLAAVSGVPHNNMDSYIKSGNKMAGKTVRFATPEDVLSRYPGIAVDDQRPAVTRVIEFYGPRAYMKENGGHGNRVVYCPGDEVLLSKDAAKNFECHISTIHRKADMKADGFRNPTGDECLKKWPGCTVIADSNEKPVVKKPRPIAEQMTLDTAVLASHAKSPVVAAPAAASGAQEVMLSDIVKTMPGVNFLALDVNEAVYLVPVSDSAKALVPSPRRIPGLAEIKAVLGSGVLLVRV